MVSIEKYNELVSQYNNLTELYNNLLQEHTVLMEQIDRIEAEKQNIVDEKQKDIDQQCKGIQELKNQQHIEIQKLKARIKNMNSKYFYHQRKAEERGEKITLLKTKLNEEGVTDKVRQMY